MADLDLQIRWVQIFFLWKYLILSHFLILKTPTEDSILCHKRDFIHLFFTKGAFACLLLVQLSCWLDLGFGNRNMSCWGCRKEQSLGILHFFSVIATSYRVFGISRVRRLHLACSVEQSSWGFFGGSISTSKISHLISLGIGV